MAAIKLYLFCFFPFLEFSVLPCQILTGDNICSEINRWVYIVYIVFIVQKLKNSFRKALRMKSVKTKTPYYKNGGMIGTPSLKVLRICSSSPYDQTVFTRNVKQANYIIWNRNIKIIWFNWRLKFSFRKKIKLTIFNYSVL